MVAAWGGVKRQRSGTPSWGKRACAAPIGVVWGLALVTKGGAE